MDGIRIGRVPRVDKNDKGPVVEWGRKTPAVQLVFFYRKAGQSFGEHFHTGKDPAKNPETFLLVCGSMDLIADNGKEVKTFRIDEMSEIEIDPLVWHGFKALTDVVFAEWRETKFDRGDPDKVIASREEFRKHLKEEGKTI